MDESPKNPNDSASSPVGASRAGKITRAALQMAGSLPYAGGFLSAIAGAWSEQEQERVNKFFEYWIEMLKDELREKEATIAEILARLNLQDQKIADRVESKAYQALVKKAFREWPGAESEEKRKWIRNILANAAAASVSSDDVVRLFIDWLKAYSEFHFQVIGAIYNSNGISRGEIWRKLGRPTVREDSADADLYKLLIRDLSMGGIIRQRRETDYHGNFVARRPAKRAPKGSRDKTLTSAFDNEEGYELTELGRQFVHYAMNELAPRIFYDDPLKSDGA